MMKREILFILIMLLSISFITSLNCDSNSITKSINVGETPSTSTIVCTNNNNYNVTLYKSGSFFSTSPVLPITINNNSNSQIQISFSQINAVGNYSGSIYASDGSLIDILVSAEENEPQAGVIVFPTSKVINVQQGQIKTQTIQVIVPSNYPSSITMQSVSMNPDIDVIRLGDLDLGILTPGQTLNIPLVVDANNVQVGTYDTKLSILATNSTGQVNLPQPNIQIKVSVGVNPSTNETFTTKPTCSLSNTEFNLNETYSFVCNNVVNNMDVSVKYNKYIEGLYGGLSGGTFTYYFKAKEIGSSTFVATFEYMGSSYFEAYEKDFKVTPSGSSSVGDVNLKLQFFQAGEKKSKDNLKAGEVIILALDNKTENIVKPFEIVLDGIGINGTTINLESNKTYTLRISAKGYNDYTIENLSVSKRPIIITLSPDQTQFKQGDKVNITTDCNASISVNDVMISSEEYTLNSIGNYTIKAYKEGYDTNQVNISVGNGALHKGVSGEWAKGKTIMVQLNENSTWQVKYFKEDGDTYSSDFEILNSSIGSMASFKLKGNGRYVVEDDGAIIYESYLDNPSSWYNPFSWSTAWQIIIGVIVALVVIYLVLVNRGDTEYGNPIDN